MGNVKERRRQDTLTPSRGTAIIGEIRKRGTGAAAGIAIGRAYVVDRRRLKFPKRRVTQDQTEIEIARFNTAIKESDRQLERIKEQLVAREGEDHFHILRAHQLMLKDEHLVDAAVNCIMTDGINAEWALKKTLAEIKSVFDALEDDYFRDRGSDVELVGNRVLRNLLGEHQQTVEPPPDAIVVARDLSPSDTAQLDKRAVAALITDAGGKTSHTAIIARAHDIPAVVGLEDITSIAAPGDLIIVDGAAGLVILNPEPQTVVHFRSRARHEAAVGHALLANSALPAETLDGHRIRLSCNVDVVDEIEGALEHGAEGVGLFRTEFLFMGRKEPPSEEEHYQHAKTVVERLGDRCATFRTFDLGGDKTGVFDELPPEPNPALGLRSIRLCLTHAGRPLFKEQLRGLLRASVLGCLRIMFPMITDMHELRSAKALLEEAKEELRVRGTPFDEKVEVGVMIEMPAAAMIADLIAKEVDFFSVGTNDLIQYALAVDRVNEHVSYLYQPYHPAILRLVRSVAEAARNANISVAMCGEMAGEPLVALVLVGFGLTELSMNASSIPGVKSVLRSTKMEDIRKMVEEVMKLDTAVEIENLVKNRVAAMIPSAM